MTVAELITKLQEMPQDKTVYLVDVEYDLVEIESVGTDTINYEEVVSVRPYPSPEWVPINES
jgi:hypothetical protein